MDGTSRRTDRIRQKDLRIGTWNVRSLAIPGAIDILSDELAKKNMDIVALQETRWPLAGKINTKDYVVYYSGCDDGRYYGGVGFAIRRKWNTAVMAFESYSERMCNIRIKGRFKNLSLVSIYAPTEEAEDDKKDMFYEALEELVSKLPNYDVRVILGDANGQIGKERVWSAVAGRESLHDSTNDNGTRLLSFCESAGLRVMSTCFPHKNIHKETWAAPNGIVKNQIDHIMIDQRHKSSIKDVLSIKGAECGSDHYLVLAKMNQRIAIEKKKDTFRQERYELKKLKSTSIAEVFQIELSNRFQLLQDDDNINNAETSVNEKWEAIKHNVLEVTKEVCGKVKKTSKKPWFDEECQNYIEERKLYKEKWLREQSEENKRRYNNKSKEISKLLRKKKRQHINNLLEKVESDSSKNSKDFYKTVNSFRKEYTPRAFGVKHNGEIIVEKTKVLDVWRDYFEKLLNVEMVDEEHCIDLPTFQHVQPKTEEPTEQEVEEALKRLRNNKAPGGDGITVEMIKAGGREVVRWIHKLILQIWREETMPDEWKEAIIIPLHKKGDKQDPNNYRGISLLSTTYKIFSKVVQKRLEEYTKDFIGEHQAGFQRGKSTTDQIFILKESVSKYWEYSKDFYGLFVDFSKAYDSVNRDSLWYKMESFGIPKKMINLVKLSLADSKCKVNVEKEYSESFEVRTGVRQGDSLSPLLFNIVIEEALNKIKETRLGIRIGRDISVLAYADDIIIMAESRDHLEEMARLLVRETKLVGLQINENKTKLVHFGRAIEEKRCLEVRNYKFEQVDSFKYLGTIIESKNNEHTEIQSRLNAATRSLFATKKVLGSKLLSYRTKLKVYKTIIRPVLIYASETWVVDKKTERKLVTFENKVLRKIFGPTKEGDHWRIRHNRELRQLFKEPDIVAEVKSRRLRWAGHILRREENTYLKEMWNSYPEGRRQRGRPKKRWKDQVEDDMRRMELEELDANDRERWRQAVGEAKYHLGYKWPWE